MALIVLLILTGFSTWVAELHLAQSLVPLRTDIGPLQSSFQGRLPPGLDALNPKNYEPSAAPSVRKLQRLTAFRLLATWGVGVVAILTFIV